MSPDSPFAGVVPRLVVFLPCHTLDDFPSWLEDGEADDLLAAWTAAWHPRLVAACGMPGWTSVDLPPPAGPLIGIVPAAWDSRFAAQFDASRADVRLVRATVGGAAIAAAALAETGLPATAAAERWGDDFRALGLAVLLSDLLARRMRSVADLESTGLPRAVAAAATAAVEGRDADARAGLEECFRCLEASRARYYPVDAWLVDLVLVSMADPVGLLETELLAPVPLGIVADGMAIATLAARDPAVVAGLRCKADGTAITACGGLLADRPLDLATPEELLAAFAAGATAWEQAGGPRPTVFARRTGGGSAFLPQLLSGLGFAGAVWSTFDGAPLPDPGAGRILWEGTGGASIETLARPPLDARSAAAILSLPERIGDAMDHDHVAVVSLAHATGTACAWHALVRRIGAWSTVLGTFVAPDDVLRRTAGTCPSVAFGPDAFPPSRPPAGTDDPLGAAVASAVESARRLVQRSGELTPLVPPVTADGARAGPAVVPASRGILAAVRRSWTGARRSGDDLVLESESIRVAVHPQTGGLLALRRPGGGPNRLSQQLAPRLPTGHGRMVADAIGRGRTASGADGVVSRGRLLDAAGGEAGTFVQGVSMVPGLPLVTLDVEVTMHGAAQGPLAEHHVACRFAWHENEDVEIRRSVHTQAVLTERTRFTAPHFVEIVPLARRSAAVEPLTILCGGLPWHVRSSPHVLDTIVAAPAGVGVRRLAVGIGLQRPWDAALELLAGVVPGSGPRPGPDNVRVTVHEVEARDGGVVRVRIGILESAGRAGRVRLEWTREVAAATARELDGRPRAGSAVAIEGRGVVVFLRAHEWLVVDLEFAP